MMRQESTTHRVSRLCSLSQTTRQLSKRAIKRANPTLSARELDILFVHYLPRSHAPAWECLVRRSSVVGRNASFVSIDYEVLCTKE